VVKTQPPYTLDNLILTDSKGPFLDSRYYQVYTIDNMGGKINQGNILIGSDLSGSGIKTVTPNSFTITPVDTNGNRRYDKLVV